MLKGILFDSDGVLVDSEEIYYTAVNDAFRFYGVRISRDEYKRIWMIKQTNTPGAIKDFNVNAKVEEIRILKDIFFYQYLEGLQMIPGALDLLQRYHRRYPYGVVTSENRRGLTTKLGRFNLMRFFDISVSADDVTENKAKSPEPYLKGCELLGFPPQNVLVIEDNPTGVKSAKDAGCVVIAYPNGFTLDLDFSRADRVVKSLDEIDEELIKILF